MASILDPVTNVVHDTAKALLDNQIPTKFAGLVNDAVTSGFGIVGDMLQIVVNLTAPPTTPTPSA